MTDDESDSAEETKAELQECVQSIRGSTEENISQKDESCSTKSSTVKPKSSNEHVLNSYKKKKILKHLMTNGCSAWSCAEVMGNGADADTALAYFNTQAKLAQSHVREESESLSFENISDWLALLQKVGLHAPCKFEAALIMKSIADNEKHPSAKDLDGVDLKSIYKFIGNALMGLPQAELDKESANFLSDEFESLINEANTDLADTETRHMKQMLEKIIDTKTFTSEENARISLDPFDIDEDIGKLI